MAAEAPEDADSEKPGERVPAVWPWLLIPLVALALFFALSKVREESAAVSASSTELTASPAH